MADVIGKGVIEVSADGSKLKAGIDDAKKSIRGLGKEVGDSVAAGSTRASRSIDNYVKKLQTSAATQGLSTRQTELYTLSLRGASKAQLEAADSALRLAEGYERGQQLGSQLRVGFIAIAAAATAAGVALAAGTIALINQVGKYQDLAEKIGDTATNVSSLKTASDVAGVSLDTIASASVKLTASLSKTDDESKLVAESVKALGINFQDFKKQSPVEQLQTVARAFGQFAEGSEKSAVAVGLLGKSGADLLPFLKEYAADGLEAAYVTAEQAKAADDFSDATARLKSQFEQFLQGTALGSIDVLNQIGDLFRSVANDTTATSVATEVLTGLLRGAVSVFQTIAVVASDVGFVFLGVGREIGAISAQLVALANLDFQGFRAISDAVKEDGARARKELDKFQAQVAAIGNQTAKFTDPRVLGNPGSIAEQAAASRPRLNISGLSRDKDPKAKKDNTAAQEAKAQLALDLDQIRKSQEAISNLISNDGKIIAAQRAANLVSESDYFQKRRELIQADTAVQEFAIEQEIARLQRESLAGKEAIENARKIADAQAKLSKIRANASTDLKVLGIQEADALADIERGYRDATAAAQSYLDTVKRANAREIAGVGAGSKAREQSAGLSSIEEKFEAQRQALQRDNRNGRFAGREADFQRELALLNSSQTAEVALYRAKYQTLDELQKDWSNGASEALQNYIDESANTAKQTEDLFTNAFASMEDALVDFVKGGKLNFKSLVDGIISDLARIAVKQGITAPLAELFKGATSSGGASGGGSFGSLVGAFAGLFGGARAIGGPVSAGSLYQINERGRPEVLEAGGKQYLMTGSQGGEVRDTRLASNKAGDTFNITVREGTSRQTANQIASQASVKIDRSKRLR